MGTKRVYQHHFMIPPLDNIVNKYYYLITLLLFEYAANGYYEDRIEIRGFTEVEVFSLCKLLPFFYGEDDLLKVDDFDTCLLERMIGILPQEQQELLTDHVILSSIDRADDFGSLSINLKDNLSKVGASIPTKYFSESDFLNFFSGKDSKFMNEYYPTKEDKDEILLRYGLKK